jgi:hypothetical protein
MFNDISNAGISVSNNHYSSLTSGEEWSGRYEECSRYASVVLAVKTDQAGTLYIDFSPDSSNTDSTLSFSVSANTNEVHRITVTRRYFRVRFLNSGSNQTFFRLQTLVGQNQALTSNLNSTIQADADATIVRPSSFELDTAIGRVSGQTAFNKFGRNESVGTTIEPVSTGGVYPTPTALTSLEIVSSSSNDTSAGTGARTVTIIGIGTNYAEVSETVTMNGITAVALANQYYRVYRAYVATSGTYASSTAGSHAGTLTIRVSGAGATWASIGLIDGLGRGQTQIASYTVPASKKLYILSLDFSIENGKAISLYLFQRTNIDTVSAPFAPLRVLREYTLSTGTNRIQLDYPLIINEKTDVGFMAETSSGTGSLSVQFDGVLIDQ